MNPICSCYVPPIYAPYSNELPGLPIASNIELSPSRILENNVSFPPSAYHHCVAPPQVFQRPAQDYAFTTFLTYAVCGYCNTLKQSYTTVLLKSALDPSIAPHAPESLQAVLSQFNNWDQTPILVSESDGLVHNLPAPEEEAVLEDLISSGNYNCLELETLPHSSEKTCDTLTSLPITSMGTKSTSPKSPNLPKQTESHVKSSTNCKFVAATALMARHFESNSQLKDSLSSKIEVARDADKRAYLRPRNCSKKRVDALANISNKPFVTAKKKSKPKSKHFLDVLLNAVSEVENSGISDESCEVTPPVKSSVQSNLATFFLKVPISSMLNSEEPQSPSHPCTRFGSSVVFKFTTKRPMFTVICTSGPGKEYNLSVFQGLLSMLQLKAQEEFQPKSRRNVDPRVLIVKINDQVHIAVEGYISRMTINQLATVLELHDFNIALTQYVQNVIMLMLEQLCGIKVGTGQWHSKKKAQKERCYSKVHMFSKAYFPTISEDLVGIIIKRANYSISQNILRRNRRLLMKDNFGQGG